MENTEKVLLDTKGNTDRIVVKDTGLFLEGEQGEWFLHFVPKETGIVVDKKNPAKNPIRLMSGLYLLWQRFHEEKPFDGWDGVHIWSQDPFLNSFEGLFKKFEHVGLLKRGEDPRVGSELKFNLSGYLKLDSKDKMVEYLQKVTDKWPI